MRRVQRLRVIPMLNGVCVPIVFNFKCFLHRLCSNHRMSECTNERVIPYKPHTHNTGSMLAERGFRDVDPENMRVATSAATPSAYMEQDDEEEDINAMVTSGVDGLVVEDSLVLTSLDTLYQVVVCTFFCICMIY